MQFDIKVTVRGGGEGGIQQLFVCLFVFCFVLFPVRNVVMKVRPSTGNSSLTRGPIQLGFNVAGTCTMLSVA